MDAFFALKAMPLTFTMQGRAALSHFEDLSVKRNGSFAPTQVALFKGERFPGCSKCRDVVGFELARGMPSLDILIFGLSIPVVLTELPVISDDNDCQNGRVS